MDKGFEYRKEFFLRLCDLAGAPRPEILRPSLPGDPCDTTNGDGGGEVRFNIEAAGDCEPEWHAAHVFGHWLADLHSGNGHAKSDEAADAIAELAMLAIFKEIKPCD
jgi:hypothetical protein